MEDFSEFLWLYFSLLLPWPSVFVAYVAEMEIWSYLVGWVFIGVLVVFALKRAKRRAYLLAWIAIWFMPGAIICGSATLVPWPMTLYGSITGSECSTPLSVLLSLFFNSLLVGAGWALVRHVAKRVQAPG